ncbi:CD209 antigen-like protein C [Clavelina lepadiformis]|uniref:CD209 antigen-like protein C n=1 Tax=Clavelina lepadiformis TaxID=159417 RepID=UPI004042E183
MQTFVIVVFVSLAFCCCRSQVSDNDEDSCTGSPVVNCNCGYNTLPLKGGQLDAEKVGRPGKQGEKGSKGDRGTKGEPGSTVAILRQLRTLEMEIGSLKSELKWFTASNGYQYRLTPSRQSWQESRRVCQSMGADLIVVGAKDMDKRLEIAHALLAPRNIDHTWMGINDIEQEGTWKWVDGSTGNAHWNGGQPDNFESGQDCGLIWYKSIGYRSDDGGCAAALYALCEKLLDQS